MGTLSRRVLESMGPGLRRKSSMISRIQSRTCRYPVVTITVDADLGFQYQGHHCICWPSRTTKPHPSLDIQLGANSSLAIHQVRRRPFACGSVGRPLYSANAPRKRRRARLGDYLGAHQEARAGTQCFYHQVCKSTTPVGGIRQGIRC